MPKQGRSKIRPDSPSPKIQLKESDFPYLAAVLEGQPELKICAFALKTATEQKLRYPVKKVSDLKLLLGGRVHRLENHDLSYAALKLFLTPRDFPIENDEELVSRIYLALRRCIASSYSLFDAQRFSAASQGVSP